MARERFEIRVADRTVELVRDGAAFFIDGRPVDLSVEDTNPGHVSVLLDGLSLGVSVEAATGGALRLRTRRGAFDAEVIGNRERLLRTVDGGDARARHHFAVRSPMPGLILKVLVGPGDAVKMGDPLVVLEAMKMENEIRATHDGIVERVHVAVSGTVQKNALLLEFETR